VSTRNDELYDFSSAVKSAIKNNVKRSFDETVDVFFRLNLDSSKQDQKSFRGHVVMPSGTGKKVSIAVFCSDSSQFSAIKDAGADYVGFEDLIEDFQNGKVSCDVCLAVVDSMKGIAKIAKLLASKGMMPNVKSGTVAQDYSSLISMVSDFKKGKVVYKADADSNLYVPIGKVSFSIEDLQKNFNALLNDLMSRLPSSFKGPSFRFFKKVGVSTTMGKGSYVLDKSVLGGV